MKIAFDATVLHGRKSGVGYYCEELLKAIVSKAPDVEYVVFSHKPVALEVSSSASSVRWTQSKFCPIRAVYLHMLLPQILAQEKPDLCHYTNFLAPFSDSTPYVVTVHDMGMERLRSAHPIAKRLYTRRLLPRAARRARLIVTNSEFSKWEIVRYLGISADEIRVTPLAASAEFRPVAANDRRAVLHEHGLSAPYFLYVGNIEPRKNLSRLLEAFASLRTTEFELVIAGTRWYRGKEAAAAAERFGVANRVRFLGYVPRAHLPALYSGSTAFIYPSLLEGFGLPVVEAMACGVPVITSDNSALREIAGDAAVLVNSSSVKAIRAAMTDILDDPAFRTDLGQRGLKHARKYSWDTTAALTLEVYREAVDRQGRGGQSVPEAAPVSTVPPGLADAVFKTIDYCSLFQYPLRVDELRERLFDVRVDADAFSRYCERIRLPRSGEFITRDPRFVATRASREILSDRAIREIWPALETLAQLPFVRMVAFSGATAHRNMSTADDVDLFIVIEDGKVWGTFLCAIVWAKLKGLRKRLCMNYVISDRVLPLFEHDAFTAQQAASLKPVYGKTVYDRFLSSNSFIKKWFPNFNAEAHRNVYPEIGSGRAKTVLENLLRIGPAQALEVFSRWILGRHLRQKASAAASMGDSDVVLEPRRLKLHMNSHKRAVLRETERTAVAAVRSR